MRDQLKSSMKARDAVRTNFLRYWIAQFTLGDGTEMPDDQAVKRLRGVAKEAQSGVTSFTLEELKLIEEWLPAQLSREQVREALAGVAETIKAAPKDGMAMGLAMKHLAGQPVDSEDVKAVVALIRSA
jgi:uncharacterized protein YqeY